MATLSVIRRWALREQMSIREISRRTGLARNTVKKYLRAGDEEPRYAKRASSSKLDPYAEKLSTWLSIEATKSRKQRRTLLQLHTAIGSKTALRALDLKRRKRSTYPHRELLCSQSGWVSIRWKSRVRDQWNSTANVLDVLDPARRHGQASPLNQCEHVWACGPSAETAAGGFTRVVEMLIALQHLLSEIRSVTYPGC